LSYHVKVVATGWAGFSGNLGGHQFKDGISVDPLPVRQIDRIAALVKCVFINEQGKEEPAGAAHRMAGGSTIPAKVLAPLKGPNREDVLTEKRDQAAASRDPAKVKYHTFAELESIGSTEGIAGLRRVGDFWNVKHRGIPQLITLILQAQAQYKAGIEVKAGEKKAQADAAMHEAVDRAKAREEEISRQARVLFQPFYPAAAPDDKGNATLVPGQGELPLDGKGE
jgi:hypothetical protein